MPTSPSKADNASRKDTAKPAESIASPSGVKSPTVSQPFIYPMRSAVSIKQPKSTGPPSNKTSSSRPSSSDGISLSDSDKPDVVFEGRNSAQDVDPAADKAMGDMHVPSNENIDLRDHLEQLTTTRFEHVRTSEGHMILTGRGGKLARCEDEPIHIPGAIQSFGAMIVIRVSPEGNMVVRQVSENCQEVLGLAPPYLFSLPTFLDVLDDEQADLLWDNIDSLDQTSEDLAETGPSVFQLRGFDMTSYDERISQGQQRTEWSAWCAAHIPDRRNDDEGELTVILEFELVDDQINPISTFSPPPSPSTKNATPVSMTDSPPASVSTAGSTGTATSTIQEIQSRGPRGGLTGQPYKPSAEELRESTQTVHKPLKALSRMRRNAETKRQSRRPNVMAGSSGADGTGGMLDMFAILSQINEQFSAQEDLNSFLKVLVGVVRDVTSFSRVMVYQFDEAWNGQVVCELVDINDTNDLYRGLHFPASDIPAQARALYKINKVRLLYDRDQPTARIVCRDRSDLDFPIDMTHAFLRAMSPIHIKYLANMGVRASMSVSITAFGELWGLISLHGYGSYGRRVSFPIRQLLRLIGDSVSRNIERLSYTRRLSARKLINTLPTDANPSGYIISNAEDLLTLFDADYGVIAIGNEAKILGPLNASQEILAVTEYLRLKKFEHLVTSQDVRRDFPDMVLPTGLQVIAGLLLVPLSGSGVDFIAFLRKAQIRHVNWAGKPFKEGQEEGAVLEPRKSFKVWSQTVEGTCRVWKDEELETASVLCLVYGKFISVWRQREQALHYNQLNRLLLSNASHEVRTPLNHIINYLELALDNKLDDDTRENLSKSHMASKSLLFVINDLLDLTKQEVGNDLTLQEPFDLSATVREAVEMHEWEAKRRKIDFTLNIDPAQCMVLGDKNRVRQVVTNTVTNSVKYTGEGQITVSMRLRPEEERVNDLPADCDIEVELVISDTGEGIPQEKLEVIFREFEQVESVIAQPGRQDDEDSETSSAIRGDQSDGGLGLGLAIVARVVKNLGGQLRVDSVVGEGSTFTYLIPFCSSDQAPSSHHGTRTIQGASVGVADASNTRGTRKSSENLSMHRTNSIGSGTASSSAGKSEIDSLVEAIEQPVLKDQNMIEDVTQQRKAAEKSIEAPESSSSGPRNMSIGARAGLQTARTQSFDTGTHRVEGSGVPVRSIKIDPQDLDTSYRHNQTFEDLAPRMRSRSNTAAETYKQEIQKRDLSERQRVPSGSALPGRRGSGDAASGRFSLTPAVETPEMSDSSVATERRSSATSLSAKRKGGVRGLTKSDAQKADQMGPLRVLVVEDDPINRMILKKRLGLDGHTTLLAVNGEEGWRQFEKDSKVIDVVLMDLQMPICNGQDACKRIREIEKSRDRSGAHVDRPAAQVLNGRVPILAVSATLTPQMRQEMTDIGMDGWLLKPIDFARLGTLLQGLLQPEQRVANQWKPGYVWEKGGWLSKPAQRTVPVMKKSSKDDDDE